LKLFESIVNLKINRITASELLDFAGQQGLTLSKTEAEDITKLIRGKSINIFDQTERKQLLTKIEKITGAKKAKQIEKIFHNMTGN
jgi:hypothetical protein